MPQLTDRLSDADTVVRAAVASAMGKIGVQDSETAALLAPLLAESDADVVLAGMAALTSMGNAGTDALPAVTSVLTHEQPAVRSAAIKCFAAINSEQSQSVSVFMSGLKDANWTVRRAAAESLGEIGPAAKAAIPILFVMLQNEDDTNVARSAIRAIDAAGSEARPVLLAGLESGDLRTQYYAVFLVGKVGPAAVDALPLLNRLHDQSESRRFKERLQTAIKQIEAQPEAEADSE